MDRMAPVTLTRANGLVLQGERIVQPVQLNVIA